MEFEAGESIIPPEMNAAYDHDEHALPSVLQQLRIVLLLVSTKLVRHLILGLFLIQ